MRARRGWTEGSSREDISTSIVMAQITSLS
jgi:hypothetical protein